MQKGGRMGDKSTNSLSEKLKKMSFKIKKLKTGTPPRIDIRSINLNLQRRSKSL